jgi:DNA-binding NtrC family response regulator
MNRCLILDVDDAHAEALSRVCSAAGFEVERAAGLEEARVALATGTVQVAFIDLNFGEDGGGLALLAEGTPDAVEVICMSAHDVPELVHEAIRRGACYYFCKPFSPELIEPMLQDIANEMQAEEFGGPSADACAVDQFGFLRGSSSCMHKLYRVLRKAATTDASLMIVGESGTGKDMVAQTAHELSPRSGAPFIAFNCAAVTETLAESELFGHEKGSFSGAHSRHRGYFEQADGGTLFLDEITEMDVNLQAKLLRVIETKTVRRLGSEESFDVDVRFICSTNRSPADAVRQGELREDLYYRLAQFPIWVPPLRERESDIAGLAQYFLTILNNSYGTQLKFSDAALHTLSTYPWPGNVRELKNFVERAYIVSESIIDVADLPQDNLVEAASHGGGGIQITVPAGAALAEAERQLILLALERHKGNKKSAAEELGISLKTLYNRLKEYRTEGTGETGDDL